MDKKAAFLQTKNIEYIEKRLGTELWLEITTDEPMNGASAGFWCGLIDVDAIDSVFSDVSWDISPSNQSIPGFEGNANGYSYKQSLLDDALESVVYSREFNKIKPDYMELSQEFVLLNNLYYDRSQRKYFYIYDSGECEEAVKYGDDDALFIKMKYLRRYAAAKQKAIVLYFDMRMWMDGTLSDNGLEEFSREYKTEDIFYECWSKEIFHDRCCSILMGKKILYPGPIKNCGYWPYEEKPAFEEFIIGLDDNGEEVTSTCDPDKLNNYFDAHPEAPFYLTPVSFKREVLQKYSAKPELYDIGDGYLQCGTLWRLEIDNHHKDKVVAYLGDLGRDLPLSEHKYWRSYNIVDEHGLSRIAVMRDFGNLFVDSDMPDHKFLRDYAAVNREWKERYGWPLFLELSDEDQYNLKQLRMPLSNSQPEFDQLVLSLVKVLIDSLNEKELANGLNLVANTKGISKFESWLEANGINDYQEHIRFLRDLYELRSSGSGHRKGKSYQKVMKQLGIDDVNLIDAFAQILERADQVLIYLLNKIKN